MVSAAPKSAETQRRRSSDPVSWYLTTIGRIPLLTPAEAVSYTHLTLPTSREV